MIFDNQYRTFERFLDSYQGDMPLARFFPDFFKKNKQMGSRDRRFLMELVYSFSRLGTTMPEADIKERLMIALFLCKTEPSAFLAHFEPELDAMVNLSLSEKIQQVEARYPDFNREEIFPYSAYLSPLIDKEAFLDSHFRQPALFLRAMRGKEAALEAVLNENNIAFRREGTCFELKNATPVETADYLFEVQDRSSQYTAHYFQTSAGEYWWDCCAASGGKSLMLLDEQPGIRLFVSDVRESILKNLDARFERAGIKRYTRRLIDLTGEITSIEPGSFDGIILDAPCTGSGTWGRTPEMITLFEEHKIEYFSRLQQQMADNVVQFLKPGKPLIYITCSVFKNENEAIVNFLVNEKGMKLEQMEYIKGYEHHADSMFVARLTR